MAKTGPEPSPVADKSPVTDRSPVAGKVIGFKTVGIFFFFKLKNSSQFLAHVFTRKSSRWQKY